MSFILSLGIFFFAVVIHEYAHGVTAYWLGDRTAKYAGRLTLNPLAHIDPVGTIFLPIMLLILGSPVVFGWAKPVPINYWSLRNPKKDIILVGLSGPAANILAASVFGLILKIHLALPPDAVFFIKQCILLNVVLAAFNLIPIPPLDGSRVLFGLLPKAAARCYASLEKYGFIIIFILLYLKVTDYILWPIVSAILALLHIRL